MNVGRQARDARRCLRGLSLVVISPARDDPRETAVLGAMLDAGLERYHVRKPAISRPVLTAWLRALPAAWRPRLVLHQYHELVDEFGLNGCHWRDDGAAPARPPAGLASRSSHDLGTLRSALGHYDSVLFGPVFPSLSKPGHGPAAGRMPEAVGALLRHRSPAERSTAVCALGGVTAARLPLVRAWGFDGAAVLGAVWQAADPAAAFRNLQVAARECPRISTNGS